MATAKVLFEYEAEQDDEIALKVGEIVKNVKVQEGGWWEGDLNGKRGVFPENFVELIKQDEPSASSSGGDMKKEAKVTFQYEPEQDDELSLEVGDIVEVLENDDEGWWKGKLKGKIGMFPSNFVELVKDGTLEKETKPALPEPLEPDVKSGRPKSQMGFGLKLEDLSRNKLKKVANKSEDHKSVPMVPPMDHGKTELEQKLPSSPPANVPAQPTSKIVQRAKVTFAYEPEQDDELKLSLGEIIVITNKNVFEGWMEGQLNGKKGLFPDNFVELLPLESVKGESNFLPHQDITSQRSVKRAAKLDPSRPVPPKVEHTEKHKPMGMPVFPPAVNKQELEKKISKPPPPAKEKPAGKGPAPPPPSSRKPKPALPQQPKPMKPRTPPAIKKEESDPVVTSPKLNSDFPRSSSISSAARHEKSSPVVPRTNSESLTRGAIPAAIKDNVDSPPGGVKQQESIDLESVKPTSEPLKHIQRAKGPSKNPPTKFKKLQGTDAMDGEDDMPTMDLNNVSNSKEVEELKSHVKDLQSKMNDMERKFKKLMMQVTDDLDGERKIRLNQQVEIDRLKKQVSLLHDH